MRFERGPGVRNLDRHLARLLASAEHFAFEAEEETIREAIEKGMASAPDRPCRVRLTLSRDGTVRVACTTLAPEAEPVRVALDDVPQDPRDVFLFHKTSRRAQYRGAAERHPAADDVLLVNDRGEVTESTIANVAVLIDGRWWTPPLDCGLLPGIGREVAIEEGRLAERRIRTEEVRSGAELALVSDTRGWRRAVLT
jgi:para-aminobenzoate synthetase / 4-amino-4-deoxychorismate lyase